MPFDGITVKALVLELNKTILNGRIDKIYQPEKDELILTIRRDKNNYKLFISANPSFPRFHLYSGKKNNPLIAPSFCMLLRKHLLGSKIISITQVSLERVVEIKFDCIDDMGYSVQRALIVEIMGRHSNIILIDLKDSKIIDSIKRVNTFMSSVRTVLPGIEYIYPPAKEKIDTLNINETSFIDDIMNLKTSIRAYKYFSKKFFGISPIVSQEICFVSGIEPDTDLKYLDKNSTAKLFIGFKKLFDTVLLSKFKSHIIIENNKNIDFSAIKLSIYNSYEKKYFDSISEVIDTFYFEKDKINRVNQKNADLHKNILIKLKRNIRKIDTLKGEYNDAIKSDYYKLCGDLIMTNQYNLKKGMNKAILVNYYNEDLNSIEIELDGNLTPIENAQKYYKSYNKLKKAKQRLSEQIINTKEEIRYLESILDSLEKCFNEEEIEEIKKELQVQGYIKKINNKISKTAKQQKTSKSMHFISSSGFNIYVGKNNTQNDYLTLKFASPLDLWLHTKDIAGSHVIIKTNGSKADDITLTEAAHLAAFFSKGKLSSNVPVDYTHKKNIKKPAGAKPGKVIYKDYNTIYITPDEMKVKKLDRIN
ncbi:MAG: NFACT family protein [Firmicutes bacterium]|nr:NFACT family protein [Bacillota bacterium]